jgi:hypothetical protein
VIDAHAVARDIISTVHGPNELNSAAVRATTAGLAACWDDCVAALPPKMREADAPNPYRLALELTPNGPYAPHDDEAPPRGRVEHRFITTADDHELAAMEIIVRALDNLDDDRARHRVITYISERTA